jgi:thiamine biosynthesis lipoprotein
MGQLGSSAAIAVRRRRPAHLIVRRRRPAHLVAVLVGFVVGCRRAPVPVSEAAGAASLASATAELERPRANVEQSAQAMGTRLTFVALTSRAADEPATRAAIDRAIAEVRHLEALMTTWRADSEVSRINDAAGKTAVVVGPETMSVIDKSLWTSEISSGVFDITFEVMHGLWKFDQDLDPRLPSPALLAKRRKLIDYRQIVVDHEKSTVFLRNVETKIGLGGIAKGYAIDRAANILLAAGVGDFMAQAGGDLYLHGHKADGSPWVAGVRDPRGPEGSYFATMPVVDHAFSTAGDYERSFVIDGKRYHHILDPRTGYPATASRSVTIWAKNAFTADALDDAVFILGPAKGMQLVDSIDEAGAIIVDAQNKVWISKRLEGKVNVLRPPTDGI